MDIPIEGEYVKADEIVQDENGERYCLPYFD